MVPHARIPNLEGSAHEDFACIPEKVMGSLAASAHADHHRLDSNLETPRSAPLPAIAGREHAQ